MIGVITIAFSGSVVFGCGKAPDTPTDWELSSSPSTSSIYLSIRVWVGDSCNKLESTEVHETPQLVSIAAKVRRVDGSCLAVMQVVDREVRLAVPLNGRHLEGCRPRSPAVATPVNGRPATDMSNCGASR